MRRQKALRLFLLTVVLVLLSLIGVVAWGTPRLSDVSPASGAVDVPAGSELQLTFSRAMLADSVTSQLDIQPETPGEFSWQGNRLIFTPQRPWPPGATVQIKLRPGARAGHFPALPLFQGYETSFTIRQPRLAFLYPADGPANIFWHNSLTGEIDPLTNVFSGVLDFDVSADGSAIYYSARNTQGGSDLYRLSLTRESEAPLTTPAPTFIQLDTVLSCPQAQCSAAKVSPDGNFLAYERSALAASRQPTSTQVWVLPLTAAGEPFQAGDPNHQTIQPSWSSNGLLAFYDTNLAAFVITKPGTGIGERARFSNQTGQTGDWRVDGEAYCAAEIFFLDPNTSPALQNLERLADSHLLLYPLDGGEVQDLTQLKGVEDVAPAFSPDGESLAFARKFLDIRQWTPGRQLWLMSLNNGQAFPLTNDPLYNHYDFAWNPAGDRLAFVRFNQSLLTEPPEVWTIDPAAAGETTAATEQATQIIIGGYAPQWIP